MTAEQQLSIRGKCTCQPHGALYALPGESLLRCGFCNRFVVPPATVPSAGAPPPGPPGGPGPGPDAPPGPPSGSLGEGSGHAPAVPGPPSAGHPDSTAGSNSAPPVVPGSQEEASWNVHVEPLAPPPPPGHGLLLPPSFPSGRSSAFPLQSVISTDYGGNGVPGLALAWSDNGWAPKLLLLFLSWQRVSAFLRDMTGNDQ
jgi:hypothetical protein